MLPDGLGRVNQQTSPGLPEFEVSSKEIRLDGTGLATALETRGKIATCHRHRLRGKPSGWTAPSQRLLFVVLDSRSLSLGVGDDLFSDLMGHEIVVAELHGERAAALGH